MARLQFVSLPVIISLRQPPTIKPPITQLNLLIFFLVSSENATRLCYANGTWAGVADYSQCKAAQAVLPEEKIFEVGA